MLLLLAVGRTSHDPFSTIKNSGYVEQYFVGHWTFKLLIHGTDQWEDRVVMSWMLDQWEDRVVTSWMPDQWEDRMVTSWMPDQWDDRVVTSWMPDQWDDRVVTSWLPEQWEDRAITSWMPIWSRWLSLKLNCFKQPANLDEVNSKVLGRGSYMRWPWSLVNMNQHPRCAVRASLLWGPLEIINMWEREVD